MPPFVEKINLNTAANVIIAGAVIVGGIVYVVQGRDNGDNTATRVVRIEQSVDTLKTAENDHRERLAKIEAANTYMIEAINRIDRTIMAAFGKTPNPAASQP